MTKSIAEAILLDSLNFLLINDIYWQENNISHPELLINTRPKFLSGLELDFYIPSLKIAFEFQGGQHYNAADIFFDNNESFANRFVRDVDKNFLCDQEGILLIKVIATSLLPKALKRLVNEGLFRYYGVDLRYNPNACPFLPQIDKSHKTLLHMLWSNKSLRMRYGDDLYQQRVKKYNQLKKKVADYLKDKSGANYSWEITARFKDISQRLSLLEDGVVKSRCFKNTKELFEYASNIYY